MVMWAVQLCRRRVNNALCRILQQAQQKAVKLVHVQPNASQLKKYSRPDRALARDDGGLALTLPQFLLVRSALVPCDLALLPLVQTLSGDLFRAQSPSAVDERVEL